MRTKYIILTVLSSLSLASCNYLDFDETNGLKTKEDMYKYFRYKQRYAVPRILIYAARICVFRN